MSEQVAFLALTKVYGWIVVAPAPGKPDVFLTRPGKWAIQGSTILKRAPLPPDDAEAASVAAEQGAAHEEKEPVVVNGEIERVRMVNVRHGSGTKGQERIIFATLKDAKTGTTITDANLDYLTKIILERRYVLVGDR